MATIGSVDLGDFPLLLAPMEDVSDPPFRALCKEQGSDLMFTEFVSVEGLIRDASKSLQKLDIYDEERPIGIQIFGSDEYSMQKAAGIVEEAQPEILDINYGCPVKKVVCKMAGAGILQDIPKMVKLTKTIVDSTYLPVTVKTRLGWDERSVYINEVTERLQDVGIKAITIHGRTRKQMYKGEANWEAIAKVKENPRIVIPVFGNGDIDNAVKAKEYKKRYGVDGIMIGRACIGNPWIFNEIKQFWNFGRIPDPPSISERVRVVRQHIIHSIQWKGEQLGILEMRRHYGNYFKGLPGIKPFRSQLVMENNTDGIFRLLDQIENNFMEIVAV